MTPEELMKLAEDKSHKPFRGRQLFEQIHMKLAPSLDAVVQLPADLRTQLTDQGCGVCSLQVAATSTSTDGTVKLALETSGGQRIETVLIPMESGQYTQCISSQAGCPLGCRFCVTGTLGFTGNLSAAEIVDQHLVALRLHPEIKVKNLVFMGMGEPLLNFDEVARAVSLLQHPRGRNVSPRRITISTAGVIPGIRRMGEELDALLAVSLNAPDQQLRESLMPVARQYPLDQLMEELRRFPLHPRRRITLEYVMLRDINDSVDQARQLVRLISHIRCKVNLIPYNPSSVTGLIGTDKQGIERFAATLAQKNVTVTVRASKGQDIEAACGQLAGQKPTLEAPD
jgi:23S rRNA (adenine2503-C2)-methyltransferase